MRLPPQMIVSDFTWREFTIAFDVSLKSLLPVNVNRIMASFGISSVGTSVNISTNASVSGTLGNVLGSSNSPLEFNYRDYGAIVGAAWFGFATGLGSTVTVIEVVYQPKVGANINERTNESRHDSRRRDKCITTPIFSRPPSIDFDAIKPF